MTTRPDRERLIQLDTGVGTDPVVISDSNNNGSRRHYHVENGHHDTDCPHAPDETVVKSRRWAQRRELPPCSRCVLGGGENPENGYVDKNCPFCNAPVKKLPHHLRSECDKKP